MNYVHFIITQFNLRNFLQSDSKSYESWVHWTRERITLFREYCLPSVLNQTNKSFLWFLYFDTDTPGEFDDFLNELKAYDFIIICHSKGYEGFIKDYPGEVKSRVPSSADWIITTRIDNDDCLHKDAVKIIQDNIICKHKYLISLASGYILDVYERTMSHYFYPMSPFLSLIENVDLEVKGIFEMGHTKWSVLRLFVFREVWHEFFSRNSRKARFILKRPMWIQLYHGKNVSNSFYRGLPVLRKKQLHDFSLGLTTFGQPWFRVFKYMNYVTWKRYFKSLIIKIIIGI